jgi:hypothetical protein
MHDCSTAYRWLEELESVFAKIRTIVARVVNFKSQPNQNVNIKVFKLENEPITLKQWAENLKNGDPNKTLILSMDTDVNGTITMEVSEGIYEVKVEKYGLSKVCELTKNEDVLFVEPKVHWWQ